MPRKLKFKKFVYPLIFGIVIILIAVILIYSAKFLAEAIDRVFITDSESWETRLMKLDMDNFYRVAKKLGISNQSSVISNQTSIIERAVVATTTATTTSSALDKTALKIQILNSTKISGLAKELKTDLEAEGFRIEKIGNIFPTIGTTTINIKQSKKDYKAIIKEAVSQKYSEIEEKELEEENIYDIIIIIGSR